MTVRLPYHISFSGGRTSGYMTKMLLDNYSDHYDFIVTFANTGIEHPKTLEFVNKCDTIFGFNTVWLEAVVHQGRKSCTYKVVDFETASRDGTPFERVIEKYGIPNVKFPGCTRELKLNPMRSYLRSIGIDHRKIPTAIGIRDDETRRVNPSVASEMMLEYPLIDIWPCDKSDVLAWWKTQPFDLEIDEFEGNCLGCCKKSIKKLFQQIERDPSVFDWHRRMEDTHRFTGPAPNERVFFRGGLDTRRLFKLYEENKGVPMRIAADDENGGCSESCEVYEMTVGDAQ